MNPLAGLYLIVTLLLAAAGALKAVSPAQTAGAVRLVVGREPGAWLVRIGGALEVVLGVASAATGARWLAMLVALSYAAFTLFVTSALMRRLPVGSCGCFGKLETPASWIHVVVDALAAATALVIAIGGGATVSEVFADQPAHGIPLGLTIGAGLVLVSVALTTLPRLLALPSAAADGEAVD
jgi:hypothetical protein